MIVPDELINQWNAEYSGPSVTVQEHCRYIANRAAQWALDRAEDACSGQHDGDHSTGFNRGVSACLDAVQALMEPQP